jgi:hypothetical protein
MEQGEANQANGLTIRHVICYGKKISPPSGVGRFPLNCFVFYWCG